MAKRSEKLEKLEQQLAEEEEKARKRKEQIKTRMKAEKARLARAERKRDTRRKVIAGAIVLQHADVDDHFRAQLDDLLHKFVADRDRSLFGLPPVDQEDRPDLRKS